MNVTVVGLGKIGLPLSVQFARRGHRVLGADISAAVVETVNAGEEPFPGEAHLGEYLGEVRAGGRFEATTDTRSAVAESEVVIVVVPLVVDSDSRPDFAAMDSATADIAAGLGAGTLVSYETTLPVGTTRGRFTPALAEASGLEPGVDLFVCHSPERVFSGRIFADLAAYPKLVGGIDEASAARAVEFYQSALEFDERPDLERPNGVWDLGSAEAAELAKLAETTYRDVNIAFANELARYSDRVGIDVGAVIEASNSQPFSHIHRPGIAVGGHCIPVYPRFYLAGDPEAKLPAAAREVNLAMPGYAVRRLEEAIGPLGGKKVAVLGAAYRGGVKETAFSGVFGVVDELTRRGAVAVVHDHLYTGDELAALGFTAHALGDPCDAAIVQTDHVEYRTIGSEALP
ncbi:MAG: nucleotide sugar dehydrogenase, partial [Acidimicrobiales bacterium]